MLDLDDSTDRWYALGDKVNTVLCYPFRSVNAKLVQNSQYSYMRRI